MSKNKVSISVEVPEKMQEKFKRECKIIGSNQSVEIRKMIYNFLIKEIRIDLTSHQQP